MIYLPGEGMVTLNTDHPYIEALIKAIVDERKTLPKIKDVVKPLKGVEEHPTEKNLILRIEDLIFSTADNLKCEQLFKNNFLKNPLITDKKYSLDLSELQEFVDCTRIVAGGLGLAYKTVRADKKSIIDSDYQHELDVIRHEPKSVEGSYIGSKGLYLASKQRAVDFATSYGGLKTDSIGIALGLYNPRDLVCVSGTKVKLTRFVITHFYPMDSDVPLYKRKIKHKLIEQLR